MSEELQPWNVITNLRKELKELKSKSKNVTRFEVIDIEGTVYSRNNCCINQSLQDDGKTLKIYVDEIEKNGNTK